MALTTFIGLMELCKLSLELGHRRRLMGKALWRLLEGQSQIYQLGGGAIATFDGMFQAFTQDGTGLVTYSEADERSQLYPLDSPLQTN